MPITGVYFIPSLPNASTARGIISERLRSVYPDEDLLPLGQWSLEQKLMRDTPSLLPGYKGTPHYMHFLSIATHYPKHGFIYTAGPPKAPNPQLSLSTSTGNGATPGQSPNPQATNINSPQAPGPSMPTPPQLQSNTDSKSFAAGSEVMTIVPSSSFGMLFSHFVYACQPFWAHRMTVSVSNGVVFDVGDFRVRLGDVRQVWPTARARGTVVEIEWRGPTLVDTVASSLGRGGEDNANADGDADLGIDVDFSAVDEADLDAEFIATATLIREFWGRLGIEGAREAILVPGYGKEIKGCLRRLRAREKRGGEETVAENEADIYAGADLAKQYMEVLRFNR
ncbi:hypothetical protein N7478_007875 [Penicillium angulare]|uniref:uncharacterized protein n=1 Tax=Penicillium angulare TaxID=116970 RepID=UPI002540A82C|nr:uncharacterized protein N7478_007875 [Penicillium angulare]KAJ5272750.1 hypothetical protein N7478_007875 [Penicillium angulare]